MIYIFNYLMGQSLLIRFGGQDYSFQILNAKKINKDKEEIQILLDGTTQTLLMEQNRWRPKENNALIGKELAGEIGKSIALLYWI
ncbi:hypothetical protein [Mucilaginibacter sp. FT3.2]|uniref:hypothetical protein n=1 Tax=Mucilaginibacter sp. FT3.2 TaxID=2723090 RepID=UPI0017DC8B04|nr:hypothetical protein [Mucilaginibacter sp. FT3.2]